MNRADKLQYLTSSIFTEMLNYKLRLMAEGRDIIDLGIGSPDLPPPEHVQQAMQEALLDTSVFGYPHMQGSPELKQAFIGWFAKRFNGIELDPTHEVVMLMGSQDGLSHLPLAILNPGDVALVPDPSYPVFASSIHLASAEPVPMPLLAENGFLPDFDLIPEETLQRAKMMILNYPGNPVPAIADDSFYHRAIEFCREHDILLVNDLAYSELTFDGYRPKSILEYPGAKDVAVEFHSLSKSFSMAGTRIGFMVGNAEVANALKTLKSNVDYGVFNVIQHGAAAALSGDQSYTRQMAAVYQERRDVLVDGLAELGWVVDKPKATMFVWAKIPGNIPSMEFALRLMDTAGVGVIPGIGFGEHGEGYVRIALVQPADVLREVVRRIEKSGIFATV